MRILITGRNGQLGSALQAGLAALGDLVCVGRDLLDLSDPAAIDRVVGSARPDVVVNAAAYTAVDRAEDDRDAAFAVNARGPAALAAACARLGAPLLHYSTDYVFDGSKPGRYLEDDPTRPLNVYGASKLAGESAVLTSGCAALVLRTAWVYGEHGSNFAKTVLRLAVARESLPVVGDQHGSPTWTGRLAELTRRILAQASESGDAHGWIARRRGVYHAAAAGATTWADYARCIVDAAAESPRWAGRLKLRAVGIDAIASAQYPVRATRPANSLLDCTKLARTFGYVFPDWRGDVVEFVRRLPPAAVLDRAR